MSEYFPAMPAVLANNRFPVSWGQGHLPRNRAKRIAGEEQVRRVNFSGHEFEVTQVEVVMRDDQSTGFADFVADAVRYMEGNADQALLEQALPYLRALDERASVYADVRFPALAVSMPEDGEVLIEWKFEHLSLGITIDADPEESGWYIVHDGTVRKTTGWGYLKSQTEAQLADQFLGQIVEHAP